MSEEYYKNLSDEQLAYILLKGEEEDKRGEVTDKDKDKQNLAKEELQTRKIVSKLAKRVPWYNKVKSWFGFRNNRRHIRNKYFSKGNYKVIAKLYNDLDVGKQNEVVSEKDFYSCLYERRNQFTKGGNVDPAKLRRDLLLYTWLKNKDFKAVYDEAVKQGNQKTLIDNFLALKDLKKSPILLVTRLKKTYKYDYSDISSLFGYDAVSYLVDKSDNFRSFYSSVSPEIQNLVRASFIESAYGNACSIVDCKIKFPKNLLNDFALFFQLLEVNERFSIFDGIDFSFCENKIFAGIFKNLISGKLSQNEITDNVSNYKYEFNPEDKGLYFVGRTKKLRKELAMSNNTDYLLYLYRNGKVGKITESEYSCAYNLARFVAKHNCVLMSQRNMIPKRVAGLMYMNDIQSGKRDIDIDVSALISVADVYDKSQMTKTMISLLDGIENGYYKPTYVDHVLDIKKKFKNVPEIANHYVIKLNEVMKNIRTDNFMRDGFTEVLKLRDLAVKSGKGSVDERIFNAVYDKLKEKFVNDEPSKKILDTLKKSVEVMNDCESPNNKSNLNNGDKNIIENEKQVLEQK